MSIIINIRFHSFFAYKTAINSDFTAQKRMFHKMRVYFAVYIFVQTTLHLNCIIAIIICKIYTNRIEKQKLCKMTYNSIRFPRD